MAEAKAYAIRSWELLPERRFIELEEPRIRFTFGLDSYIEVDVVDGKRAIEIHTSNSLLVVEPRASNMIRVSDGRK